jgi:hypothetical protein
MYNLILLTPVFILPTKCLKQIIDGTLQMFYLKGDKVLINIKQVEADFEKT